MIARNSVPSRIHVKDGLGQTLLSKSGTKVPFSSGKKAAVNWTIGKLLQIILLVVVLVMLVFGVSSGMIPSIDKIGEKFDGLLIMLNIKDDPFFEECYSESVTNFPDGVEFLEVLGIEEEVVLNICRERTCNFSEGSLSGYRSFQGEFQLRRPRGWESFDNFFDKNKLDEIEFSWELYSEGIAKLDEIGFGDYYDKKTTDILILYSDGQGALDQPIYAIWQSGYWIVVEGLNNLKKEIHPDDEWKRIDNGWVVDRAGGGFGVKIVEHYPGKAGNVDNDLVMDIFIENVDELDDDEVSWDVIDKDQRLIFEDIVYSDFNGEKIGTLWGDDDVDELDSAKKIGKFRNAVVEKTLEFSKGREFSEEEDVGLEEAMDGEVLMIGEKEFKMRLDSVNSVVEFYSESESFVFAPCSYNKFYGDFFIESRLRKDPICIVRSGDGYSEWWKGVDNSNEFGDPEIYRLSKKEFGVIKKAELVNEFLGEKCR